MTPPNNSDAPADECLLCRIVRGDVPASFAYRDATVVAFMDLQPVTPGHLLVVPRDHHVGLSDLPVEVGRDLWSVGQLLGRALRRSGLTCEGVNLFLADGKAAFQEIFHVHLHVFPRFPGDSFRLDADWQVAAREDLDATAAAVRHGIDAVGTRPAPPVPAEPAQ